MNINNNIYNQKEVDKKIADFTKGKDYEITPSEKADIQDYTFFNDRLKSFFGGVDRVPVRVWREKYDGSDYKYRGHFEEGKNYSYSFQGWQYDPNYQGSRGTDDLPEWMGDWMKDWKWDEHRSLEVHGEAGNAHTGKKYWEKSWTYKGKANKLGTSWEEAKKIEPNQNNELELKRKHEELMNKLSSYQKEPQSKGRDMKIEGIKKHIAELESKIEGKNDKVGYCNCGFKVGSSDNYCEKCGTFLGDKAKKGNSDLERENQELRQQLATVQTELVKVLAELKKLTGKGNPQLEKQQTKNKEVLTNGSPTQIQEQVAKSQALVKELSANTKTISSQEPKNSSLSYYLVGGSVLVVGLGGIAIWLKKRNKK